MNIIVLSKLSFGHALRITQVAPLVQQKDLAAGRGARDHGVHHDDIWLHNVISQLCRGCVHKKGRNHDQEGAGNQKTNVLVRKKPIFVGFVHFENLTHLCVGETHKFRVLLPKFLHVILSNLFEVMFFLVLINLVLALFRKLILRLCVV